MKITIAQTKPVFLDIERNFRDSLKFIKKADTGLIVFPELYLSGYTFSDTEQVKQCAMDETHPVIKEYKNLTKGRDIALCGGYVEKCDDHLYNSSFFIAQGKMISNYRKTHLFFREKDFFSEGNTGYAPFKYKDAVLGMMICFDWYFPEVARVLALQGVQIILHPSNLVLPYCQKAMFARALENRIYIVTSNRIGRETNNKGQTNIFRGQSQIVNPRGEYILKLPVSAKSSKSVNIDPSIADDKHITPMNNWVEDRKTHFFCLRDL